MSDEVTVRVIARPNIDWNGIEKWVAAQGGDDWTDRVADAYQGDAQESAEILVEAAGRRCYKSWTEGLNPNVTRVRKSSSTYIRNIIAVDHGSVLEHAQYTFAIENVDRVVTHELVRHRVGTAISQESQRYVRVTDIPFRHPDWVAQDSVLNAMATDLIDRIEAFQRAAVRFSGIDDEGRDFHYKKEVTSDMRRYLPQGVLTGLVWSANLRTLRQTIEARTASGAEREIRVLFDKIGHIMLDECPNVFDDFVLENVENSSVPAWVPGKKAA